MNNKNLWLLLLKYLLVSLVGISLFLLILWFRIPFGFRPAIIQMKYGFTLPIPILFIICMLLMTKYRLLNIAALFWVTMIVYAMALAGLWASGQTEGQVISGILPDSDAAFYFYDALRLNSGLRFSTFGSMRIFYSTFLSSLLFFTNASLVDANSIQVLLLAFCAFLATHKIWGKLGRIPASLFFVLIFVFARISVGKLMSEVLGLSLSLLVFYFFFDKTKLQNTSLFFLTIVLWTTALIARVGPLTAIPLMVYGIYLNEKSKFSFKKILVLMCASILFVLIIFSAFSSILGSEDSIPFSNFVHPLYGLAKGGKGWSQIFFDHPEIIEIPEPDYTKQILQFALEEIQSKPENLVIGLLKQYPQILNFTNRKGIFSFVGGDNDSIYNLMQVFLYILSFYYFYQLVFQKKYEYRHFAFAFLGIFLLAPIFPFIDFEKMRVYAAVMPFIVMIPVLGLYYFLNESSNNNQCVINVEKKMDVLWLVTSIYFIQMIFFIPLMIYNFNKIKIPKELFSSDRLNNVVVHINSDSFIHLHRESDFFLDWLPHFHESRFVQFLHNLSNQTVQAFENVHAPASITSVIDLRDGTPAILVFPDQHTIDLNGLFLLEGSWDDYDYSRNNARVFFVEYTHALSTELD